jgi:hypothetical protein
LEATLSRIVNDPALESAAIEPLLEIEANLKGVIVCITTFGSLGRLIPGILLHCGNVMADNDRSGSLRHEGSKEPRLPFSETLSGDCAKVATRP